MMLNIMAGSDRGGTNSHMSKMVDGKLTGAHPPGSIGMQHVSPTQLTSWLDDPDLQMSERRRTTEFI